MRVTEQPCGCIYQCKDTNFKANHNSLTWLITSAFSCIYQCKDTNFKANHNKTENLFSNDGVVFTNAKILILKLITTKTFCYYFITLLYLPMQRY